MEDDTDEVTSVIGVSAPLPAEVIQEMQRRVHQTLDIIEESKQASGLAWLPVTSLLMQVLKTQAGTSTVQFCDIAKVWQELQCPFAQGLNYCTIKGPTCFCVLERHYSEKNVSVVDSNVPSIGGMSSTEELLSWAGWSGISALIEAVRVFAILKTFLDEGDVGVDDEQLCQDKFDHAYIQNLSKSSGVQMCLLKKGAVYANIVANDLRLHLASIREIRIRSPISSFFVGSLNSYKKDSSSLKLPYEAERIRNQVRGLSKKLNLTKPGAEFQAWAAEIEAMVDSRALPFEDGSPSFLFCDVLCARSGEKSGALLLGFVHDIADHFQLPVHLGANMGTILFFKKLGYELRLDDKSPVLPFDDLHISDSDLSGDFFHEDKLKKDFAALNVSCASTTEEATEFVAKIQQNYPLSVWEWIGRSGCINRHALKLAFRALHMGLGTHYCGTDAVRSRLTSLALNTPQGVMDALADVIACVKADEGFRMVRLPSAPKALPRMVEAAAPPSLSLPRFSFGPSGMGQVSFSTPGSFGAFSPGAGLPEWLTRKLQSSDPFTPPVPGLLFRTPEEGHHRTGAGKVPAVLFWTSKLAMLDQFDTMNGKHRGKQKRSLSQDVKLTRKVLKSATSHRTWIQRLHDLAKDLKKPMPELWDTTAFADHTLDPEKITEYLRRIALCSDSTFSVSMAETIAKIRYITVEELKTAIRVLVNVLNQAKQLALEAGKEILFCVLAPPNSERSKSNMWITLFACSLLDFNLAFDFRCFKDHRALQQLEEIGTTKEVHVVAFDDVMYSGDQMSRTILGLRQQLPPSFFVYACVPFVHREWCLNIIHPFVRDQVRLWSKDLPLAHYHMDFTKFSSGTAAMDSATLTLTYTQSKMPDMMSFPSTLSTASNPFIAGTTPWQAYRRDFSAYPLITLVRNCEEGLCPAGGYKAALVTVPARKCSDNRPHTGSACVQFSDNVLEHGLSRVVLEASGEKSDVHVGPPSVQLVNGFTPADIVLPPSVAIKTPRRIPGSDLRSRDGFFTSAELQKLHSEAAALRRVQGIPGVVKYYGCFIAPWFHRDETMKPSKISRNTMQQLATDYAPDSTSAKRYQFGMVLEDLSSFSVPKDGKSLPALTKQRIIDTVKAIHGKGVVHGDLWLPNILISPDGKDFRIIDFGESCLFRKHETISKSGRYCSDWRGKVCAGLDGEKLWSCLVRRDLDMLHATLNS
jgi:hypothetical protein